MKYHNSTKSKIKEVIKAPKEFTTKGVYRTNTDYAFFNLFDIKGLRFFEPIEKCNWYYVYNPETDISYSLPYNECKASHFGNWEHLSNTFNIVTL